MNGKRIIATAALALTTLATTTTYAWKTVYDPTNYAANLETKIQMIKQVQQQAEQLQHELANLAKLSPSQADQSLDHIRELLSKMNALRNETNAIGTDYREMMEQFDELRPDYSTWNGVSAEEYANQTDKLRAAWERSVEQAMKSQGMASPTEQQKTAAHIERLVMASQNAQGAMGALQAANQIAALQIQELQKMQAIMADSMRTTNLYYQKKIDAEMQARKISEEFAESTKTYKNMKIRNTGDSELGHYTR